MICVLVDAAAVAFVDNEPNGGAFLRYVRGLLSWRHALENGCFRVFSSRRLASALAEAGAYPFWASIEKALTAHGLLDEFQAKDIVGLANALIEKTELIEDALEVGDALAEEERISPEEMLGDRPKPMVACLHELLMFATLLPITHEQLSAPFFLATHSDTARHPRIEYSARLVAVEPEERVAELNLALPSQLQLGFITAASISGLVSRASALQFTQQAKWDAFKLAIVHWILGQGADFEDAVAALNDLSCGAVFMPSCEANGFLNHPAKVERLLRACVETATNTVLQDTHALRTGPAGNDPQVRRGTAFAWRRDIDYEFHLHYWRDGSAISLSKVVTHNDFTIE